PLGSARASRAVFGASPKTPFRARGSSRRRGAVASTRGACATLVNMTTEQFLISAWTWNPLVCLVGGLALAGYAAAFGWQKRIGVFLAALAVFLLTLLSPVHALA